MKTKLFLLFCLAFVLCCQTYAQIEVKNGSIRVKPSVRTSEISEGKLIYQLCSDEIYSPAGVRDDNVEVRAYIRVPAKQWKGCKITNVEFGIGFAVGRDSYVFISNNLEAEPLIKQDFQCDTIPPAPDDDIDGIGWKNVPLSEPYTIDSDDDLYIGWYTVQDYWDQPFTIDESEPVPGGNLAAHRRSGEENWTYQEMPANISVKVTIEGESFLQNHMRMVSCSVDKMYYKLGTSLTMYGMVVNEGTQPVESFDIVYKLNEDESITKQITDTIIQPFKPYSFQYITQINKEGKGSLVLSVANPNGKPDEFEETTSATYDSFGCLAKGVQRNVLIDEAVGVDDPGAAGAAEIIQEAIDHCDRKENVIWIQNHVLANDMYTISGFKNYGMLYDDAIFTPSVNIDHKAQIPGTFMLDQEGEKVPATTEMFVIDNDFSKHLTACLDDPEVYFSLGVECQLVDEDVLKVTMKATPALEGLFPDILRPKIALLLIEDSIVGKQTGVEGDYIHRHIPRTFLTEGSVDPGFEFMGELVPFPKEGFTLERKFVIPDSSWKVDNLSLVFYVMDAAITVKNAATCPVKPKTVSINNSNVESDFTVICRDGNLHIEGDFDKAWIFKADGQKLMEIYEANTNVSGWSKGIHCVLIQKGNRFVSEKFILK